MTHEHEGDPTCEHQWVTDNLVVCTDPPLWHRICQRCGRVEHVDGQRTPIREAFGDIYDRFWTNGKPTVWAVEPQEVKGA